MTITTYSAYVPFLEDRPYPTCWAFIGPVEVEARMSAAVAVAVEREPEAAVLRVRSSTGAQLVGLMPAGLAA